MPSHSTGKIIWWSGSMTAAVSTGIYGVRVRPDGVVLDPTAIPISHINLGLNCSTPAVASRGEDYRFALGSNMENLRLGGGPVGQCLVTYTSFDTELEVSRVKARLIVDVEFPVGDVNHDGCVDRSDLNLLLEKIRGHSNDLGYDMNGDGTVDISDARFVALHFSNPGGAPCP